jgi:hypothetical protein
MQYVKSGIINKKINKKQSWSYNNQDYKKKYYYKQSNNIFVVVL